MTIENGKIYKITNELNGKVYIGMTTRKISVRWGQHRNNSKTSNYYLYRSMRKHGIENFKFEVVMEGITSWEKLKEMEKYYIKEHDSFKNGYNSTLGGDGTLGHRHTEEHKRYLSKVLTGIKRTPAQIEKNRKARTGAKQEKSTIEKRMRFVRGVPKSPEHTAKLSKILNEHRYIRKGADHFKSMKVVQKSKETGEIIAYYETISEAEIKMRGKSTNGSISRAINGKLKSAYGFIWERANDSDGSSRKEIVEVMQKNTPPTHGQIVEMNRLYKEEGKSIAEVGRIVGFHRNTVSRYLNMFRQFKPSPEYILDGVNLETKTWSKEDSQYIVDYYPVATVYELAYALDKTPNQVTSRIMHLRKRGLLEKRKKRGRLRKEI